MKHVSNFLIGMSILIIVVIFSINFTRSSNGTLIKDAVDIESIAIPPETNIGNNHLLGEVSDGSNSIIEDAKEVESDDCEETQSYGNRRRVGFFRRIFGRQ